MRERVRIALLIGKFCDVDASECQMYPATAWGTLPVFRRVEVESDGRKDLHSAIGHIENSLTGDRTALAGFGGVTPRVLALGVHRPTGRYYAVAATDGMSSARTGNFELTADEATLFFEGCGIEPPPGPSGPTPIDWLNIDPYAVRNLHTSGHFEALRELQRLRAEFRACPRFTMESLTFYRNAVEAAAEIAIQGEPRIEEVARSIVAEFNTRSERWSALSRTPIEPITIPPPANVAAPAPRDEAADASKAPPSPLPLVDEDAPRNQLVTALLNAGKAMSARLVAYMADRERASYEEICEYVYEKGEPEWSTVKSLVNRTNNALLEVEAKATARRFKFRVADMNVLRVITPE